VKPVGTLVVDLPSNATKASFGRDESQKHAVGTLVLSRHAREVIAVAQPRSTSTFTSRASWQVGLGHSLISGSTCFTGSQVPRSV
jgi:hypothetical protein